MTTFEEGFAAAERSADSVLKALGGVSTLARQMRKAAQDGNIAAVRRTSERLQDSIGLIQQEVTNAAGAWPFTPEEELEYLDKHYSEELKEEALKKNLHVFERERVLVVSPSVVRVNSSDRGVQINRSKSLLIRPTRIVGELEKLQSRGSAYRPTQFLSSLHNAYVALTGVRPSDAMKFGEVGQVVPLVRIYNLFTGLPGANLEYSQLDFARDLYSLETSGVREVRGTRVSFPASTGTRSPRETFSFVGPDGETVLYYGIQFIGVSQ